MYQYPPRRKQWKSNFRLLTFTYPQESDHLNRKYRIMIRYYDGESQQEKDKTIYFGLEFFKTKVEGQQPKNKRKSQLSPFHPYFWEQNLLNNKDTMQQSFVDVVRRYLLKREQSKSSDQKTPNPSTPTPHP